MYRHPLSLLSLVVISACLGGQSLAQQAGSAPAVPPGGINVQFSRVFTLATGTGMGHSHGVEGKLSSGTLQLGVKSNAGKMVFDMASFDVDTPRSRKVVGLEGDASKWAIKKVNEVIHGDKVLSSRRFPQATFVIESAVGKGVDRWSDLPMYQLTGMFTLRGRTHRISFPVVVRKENGWHHVLGSFKFKQSDYGITPFTRGFGALGIADELKVHGDLWVAPSASSIASLESVSTK